jgi:hypothetical protein
MLSACLDYGCMYDTMQKPAFVFDGRNIIDPEKLREIQKSQIELEQIQKQHFKVSKKLGQFFIYRSL